VLTANHKVETKSTISEIILLIFHPSFFLYGKIFSSAKHNKPTNMSPPTENMIVGTIDGKTISLKNK